MIYTTATATGWSDSTTDNCVWVQPEYNNHSHSHSAKTSFTTSDGGWYTWPNPDERIDELHKIIKMMWKMLKSSPNVCPPDQIKKMNEMIDELVTYEWTSNEKEKAIEEKPLDDKLFEI
jgi:hypothetical protein